ncbi:MAG: hypothetical protein CMJ18_18780 [Phycisphaeraceae bacterium]|nr:hypothetical protein [Phycisphaeraceae bacterium]
MHGNRRIIVAALIVAVTSSVTLADAPRRKIIEYGWDVPTPAFIVEHIDSMQRQPFDGLIFRLEGHRMAFDLRRWNARDLAPQAEQLTHVRWGRFTDNFPVLWSSVQKMDWFDDAQWETIEHNLGLVAKIARQTGCRGVAFDPEPYDGNPWAWPNDWEGRGSTVSYADRKYEDLWKQVRRRGAQFISALQREMPNLVLFTFYQLSLFNNGPIMREPDPARRMEMLSKDRYGLLLAFTEGFLEGAGPNVRIVDGASETSNHHRLSSFHRSYHRTRAGVLNLLPSTLHERYRQTVEFGPKLFVDYLYAIYPPETRNATYFINDEQRQRLMEYATWCALETTDRYVWVYSERMNWWQDQRTGHEHRVRAAEAIASALTLHERGKAPDPSIEDAVERGIELRAATIARRMQSRTARVRSLSLGMKPPAIDGRIDDAAWSERTRLEALVSAANDPEAEPDAATVAWVTYDDGHLYVAIRCDEPSIAKLNIRGDRNRADGDVWAGDCVEVFISDGAGPTPNRHLIVNPRNWRWDGEGSRSDWNGDWRSATRVRDDAWYAEFAFPWAQAGGRPAPGSTRRANVARQRKPVIEWSTWSPITSDFLNFDELGTWRFMD